MTEQSPPGKPPAAVPRLGEIGLTNYAPYLMNRIMGRYNASLRDEMAGLGPDHAEDAGAGGAVGGRRAADPRAWRSIPWSNNPPSPARWTSWQADGLIRRETDATDSRATRVFITEAGRTRFETLWPHMAEAQARMFRGIPDDERRAFVGTLQKMLTNIRKHEI